MPRLFTGLEIPQSARTALSFLRGGLLGARWVEPEDYHVTLRFIGDIDARTADEIAAALARVQRPPLELTLSGLGAFGGNKPHAVWARVEPSPALTELQSEHERIMQRLGLDAEPRRYTPHVTLARLRNVAPADVAHWLGLYGGFRAGPFAMPRFVLYSSRASTGGGPYLVEEAYPLAA